MTQPRILFLFLCVALFFVTVRTLHADVRLGSARLGSARLGIGPAVDPCAGTPSAGTECTGGAKYVGTFDPQDGNGVKKYMTTPADATGTYVWANVNENNVTARSTTDGLANTIVLEGRGVGYAAGYYCGTLSANGYSDWFLPANDELNLLYTKKVDVGGFAASNYRPSTEFDVSSAWVQNFNSGAQGPSGKNTDYYVRCVRRY